MLGNRKIYSFNSRISTRNMIFLSLLLGIYSVICSPDVYVSDRSNYVFRFVNGYSEVWTIGLRFLAYILHRFTNEPKVLFFVISVGCMLVTLMSYNQAIDAYSYAIKFMILSQYSLYSFYLLKQAPALAFAALSMMFFFKRRYFSSIIILCVAIVFHESAVVLIPLYLIIYGAKKRWIRILEYIFCALVVVFFAEITSFLTMIIGKYIPQLVQQANLYLAENGSVQVEKINLLTVLKGIPYYSITFYALYNRRRLKDKIINFDKYLVLSVFASTMIVLSSYMYWMWRFGTYCYFPMFIFASLLIKECKSGKEKRLFELCTLGTSAFFTIRYLFQIYFTYGGF